MRLLVLGGTVFLSAAVAAEAVRRGHEVTALARGTSGTFPAGVRAVRGDRLDTDVLEALGRERWDAVVDVARRPSHVRTALAALSEVRTWVFVSSCSVYADQSVVGADEGAALLEPLGPDEDETDPEHYGRAKVACEALVLAARTDRALVVRAGLIVGPGDPTDRFGWWPAVLAGGGDVVAPEPREAHVQVLDVRDLAAWLVDAAEQGRSGIVDAVGEVLTMGELLEVCRLAVGTGARLRWVPARDLLDAGIAVWSGPESLPLWLGGDPDWAGFLARSGAAARAAGLRTRPLEDTVRDTLADEGERGLDRPRAAGLSPVRHAELLAAVAGR